METIDGEPNRFPLARFVDQLWQTGVANVPAMEAVADTRANPAAADRNEAFLKLAMFASDERDALAGAPPPLSQPAAEWAAVQFYRACSLLIHRETSVETMQALLREPCPEPASPSTVYSVDLMFRHLPELARLTPLNDPFAEELLRWGCDWPLSSVGMAFPSAGSAAREFASIDVWSEDCALRSLYVDRLLAANDVSRLGDARIERAVRAALGDHGWLAPKMAAALEAKLATT